MLPTTITPSTFNPLIVLYLPSYSVLEVISQAPFELPVKWVIYYERLRFWKLLINVIMAYFDITKEVLNNCYNFDVIVGMNALHNFTNYQETNGLVHMAKKF